MKDNLVTSIGTMVNIVVSLTCTLKASIINRVQKPLQGFGAEGCDTTDAHQRTKAGTKNKTEVNNTLVQLYSLCAFAWNNNS